MTKIHKLLLLQFSQTIIWYFRWTSNSVLLSEEWYPCSSFPFPSGPQSSSAMMAKLRAKTGCKWRCDDWRVPGPAKNCSWTWQTHRLGSLPSTRLQWVCPVEACCWKSQPNLHTSRFPNRWIPQRWKRNFGGFSNSDCWAGTANQMCRDRHPRDGYELRWTMIYRSRLLKSCTQKRAWMVPLKCWKSLSVHLTCLNKPVDVVTKQFMEFREASES